jgi:hypothetical protein
MRWATYKTAWIADAKDRRLFKGNRRLRSGVVGSRMLTRRVEVVEVGKWLTWLIVVVAMALGGCGAPAGKGPAPEDLLPDSDAVAGWERSGEGAVYVPDNLFDYMDGQAELFFVYNFEELAVQEYQRGQEGPIIVEVYQVASPADAYGLFSFYATGEPLDLGAGGAVEPGRLISFWQGRFYARAFAYGEAEHESLSALAHQVADGMPEPPESEEGVLPELVTRLPQENLVPHSARFFHQKLSLDSLLWLGDENILNLSEQTNAVLAVYTYDDTQVQLLVVEYPNAATAEAAHAALDGSGLENLSAASQSNQYLVAVFDAPDQAIAHELLQKALANLSD